MLKQDKVSSFQCLTLQVNDWYVKNVLDMFAMF